ncbi:MAG: hypothetical protein KGJ80_11705 [Chloroflexota bacterium]|nr:hypothetical protein [Chloroflexota bacterium]
MRRRSFQILLWTILGSLGLLACDVASLTSLSGASKPQVTIQSPSAGAQFQEGDDVPVQSTATDKGGIVRVELWVDGSVVRADAPPTPQGQTSFSVIQTWKAIAGSHTLSVRAYSASGAASDPALVTVTVTPSTAVNVSPTAQTLVPPLGAPTLSLTPTLPPVETTVTATPTRRPPTPTPTLTAPPGVWALSIRVDPTAPKRGQAMTFFVKFVNATGAPQHYKWFAKIYPPDAKNSKGETPKVDNDFPVGTAEFQSAEWKLTGPGPCEDYFARVFWIDPDSKVVTEFVKPDQSGGPATGFQVCP